MSISQSLNNALSGLNAATRQAAVSSSNLSNALTEGYGRRTLGLSADTVGGRGAGVRIDGISRIVDRGIVADRRLADAALSSNTSTAQALGRIEALVGAPGDGAGLGARLASFEAALFDAANDPSSGQRLSTAMNRLDSVTNSLNDSAAGLRREREMADKAISTQIERLNTSLRQVEQLNIEIQQADISGIDPSAFMDQRQRVIDTIAEIVPVRELDRKNGAVALMTPSGEVMIDGPAVQYDFAPTTVIMPHMSLGAGTLGGISRDGVPMSSDGFGRLRGGGLEASFALRDTTIPQAEEKLDALARDLVERFQDTGTDPTLAGGDPGLLTDNGAAFDPLNTTGLAGRISVNAAASPSEGGDATLLRDGVGSASTPRPVSDSVQINRWIDALNEGRVLSTGGVSGGAADHANTMASQFGSDRLAADEELSFANARWSALKEAELATGVDSDAEMQMLLRVEQAYAANARVIETVQSMILRLMEI